MLIAKLNKSLIEAGCDEAGRGCLAGPVFAAAVVISNNFNNVLLNDSKKINEKNRYFLRDFIIKNAEHWAVASVDNNEIDTINILNASIKAMHKALDKLKIIPQFLLIDGNKFTKYKDIEHKTVIKGDGKYMSIAAASILAKTFRDDFMRKIDKEFPDYLWKNNKGYPTKYHKKIILNKGLTKYHRKTFCDFYFQQKIKFKEH